MQLPRLLSSLSFRHLSWWFIFIVYVIACFYASYASLPDLPEKYQVNHSYLIASDVNRPDLLNSYLRTSIKLPDWDSAHSLDTTSLWYQIPLSRDANEPTKQAVYLPQVSQNVQAFLNGVWLGNGGNMTSPITRNRNNALLFNFDGSQLLTKNTLSIQVVGPHASRTYIGEIYIGPVEPLRTHAEINNALRIGLPRIITLCMLLTSIIVSVLWVLRQSDTYYLYFGVFSALWAFYGSNNFIRDIPLSSGFWETLMPLSFGTSMLGIILFLHRYAGTYNQNIERFLVLTFTLISLPFLYQNLDWILFYAYHIWSPIISLIGVYSLFFLYSTYKKTREDRYILLFISGCSIMVFGFNDLLLIVQLTPKQSPYMMHFAILFTMITIIATLIHRFIQSIHVVEHYNQELQHEVRSKTGEIESSYQYVQQLMRKYTVAEERQRIMRDIHDGIGGQLVATLVSMEVGPVSQDLLKANLKAALQDLRMVIDSLDDEAEDLPTLLGMLRMRLSEQLSNANLKLHWQVNDLPKIENFGPANVLNTMRIIQEAITNAIKHSNAKNLTISTSEFTGADYQRYDCIEVTDDGCGISAGMKREGRGLLNMKKRADLIGGRLTVIHNQGTTIRLELPLNK